MKNLIIASTSTIYKGDYLEYLLPEIKILFNNTKEILFIPYARPGGISHSEYTSKVAKVFNSININVKGLHEFEDTTKAIKNAEGIFTGGGNTFVLVNQLYKNKSFAVLKEVINSGTPYLGTSAGSNICGLTMHTTNDMPIVYPPSFKTIGLVPFNINPHYLDPLTNSEHMGETRETRLKEFHKFNTQPVVGLREGSWLEVNNNTIVLKGNLKARIFEHQKQPYELEPNSFLNELK
ncbi:dipeptidase PepE [Lacinutrix salivirga]